MEDKREDIVRNTGEGAGTEAEEARFSADSVVDDGIQYTFVVPKGEVFREPEEDSEAEAVIPEPAVTEQEAVTPDLPVTEPEPVIPDPPMTEPEPAATILADRRRFTDAVNDALQDAAASDAEDEFFRTYKAADPTGNTIFIDPPVYDSTGLPDDDITYTFVVPKGEVYKEPDPEEERAAKEAEKARMAAAAAEAEEQAGGADSTTHYGLPANHPAIGELARKQEERRLYKQRKRNRLRTRFYVFMTALILLVFWLIISNSGVFTIDAIEVRGNSHYTAEEIINIGHASSGRNIIYKANIKETKEFLEQNPYIKSAEIRRRLPSTLVIKVTEREERLAFRYDDDYLVMDEDGILLKKTRNKPRTTIIQGIVVSRIKLGETIGTEDPKRMDMALALIKTMIASDLYYVKVDLSTETSVKAYIYDTLVVKADYDTLMTNMENGRLHLVMEKLFEDSIERGTITFGEDGSASFMPSF